MFLGFGENLMEKWGLENEAQLFFILRWQELFDLETYNSWRVRTSSVKTIMNELIVGLEMAQTFPRAFNSLKDLLEEALDIANTDIVIKNYYPLVKTQIENLKKLFEKSDNETNRDLNLLGRHIGLISSQLSSYTELLFKHVKKVLINPAKEYKNDLYGVSMSLAIELSSNGFSSLFLKENILILQNEKRKFGDRISDFLQLFSGKEKEFTACFPVRISLKDIVSKEIEGVRFVKSDDCLNSLKSEDFLNGLNPNEFDKFKSKYSNSIFAKVNLNAMDPFGAYERAKRKIERALASIRLFHFEGDADLSLDAIIENDQKPIVCIDYLKTYKNYLQNTKKPLRKIEELSNVIAGLDSKDRERISAVLQYHRLAMSAHTDEARFVNLWVALECLVRISGKSVIANVCELVIPSLVTQHMHGIVKGLAIDLRHAWRSADAKVLHEVIGIRCHDSARDIPLDKIITWLIQDDNQPEIKCIYDLITKNPLATFRVDRLQQRYFKSYEKSCAVLKTHHKHLDWQIKRIYRVRNLLVHWGQYSPALEQLTQHLHSYLILTLQNILRDLSWNKSWSIVQALEFRSELYKIMVTDKISKDLLSERVILNPALLITDREKHGIWK